MLYSHGVKVHGRCVMRVAFFQRDYKLEVCYGTINAEMVRVMGGGGGRRFCCSKTTL